VLVAVSKVKQTAKPCSDNILQLFEQIAGLSGPVGEMIQSTGDIGTQWILDLSNGIAKELWLPV